MVPWYHFERYNMLSLLLRVSLYVIFSAQASELLTSVPVFPLARVRLLAWPLRSDGGAHAARHIWLGSQERSIKSNPGVCLREGMQCKYVWCLRPALRLPIHTICSQLDFEQYTLLIPGLRKKQTVTNQSLGKIEDGLLLYVSLFVSSIDSHLLAVYTMIVRSSEYDLPPEIQDDIVMRSISQFSDRPHHQHAIDFEDGSNHDEAWRSYGQRRDECYVEINVVMIRECIAR